MSGYDHWNRPEALVGTVLDGRYQIVRLLGTGGMGAVYEGRHVKLDKQVAVKVLAPGLAAQEKQRKRFLREARAANRIEHENVVDILDFGEEPVTYFVMEYLQGVDLADLISQTGALPWERARPIMLQILGALEAAHAAGIIHRDMKPSNCFLPTRKGTDFVKVLDFGIAKVAESSPETRGLTRTNEVMGTVTYMSPEQALGRVVDARTDIYASGILLYEMVTGKVPFDGTNSFQVLEQQVRAAPPPPRTMNPAVSEAVEGVILKALEKDPAARFQSMTEFIAAIEFVDAHGHPQSTQRLGDAPPVGLAQTAYLPEPYPAAAALTPIPHRPITGPPDTSPSVGAATEPTVTFSGEGSKKGTIIALALVGLLAATGGGIAVGFAVSGPDEDDDKPTVARADQPAPKAPVAEPEPEADPEADPDALVIGAEDPPPEAAPPPEPEAAEAAPPELPSEADTPADPEPPAEPAPAAAPEEGAAGKKRQSKNRRDKGVPAKHKEPEKKPEKKPEKAKTDSVYAKMASIKSKAKSRCGSGVIGGKVTVTFLIRPDGGTSLVKPQAPNQANEAGRCVANLVKATSFGPGSDGRRTLTVIF